MPLAILTLLALLMPFSSQPTRMDADPLSTYRWTHRLLVVHFPDTESGLAALEAFRTALEARVDDLRERELLIVPVGDLPRAGDALWPGLALIAPERLAVRQRLGLQSGRAQLVLIGKDGREKARQSAGVFDLARVFELIDGMPMRRGEMQRR